MEILYLLIPLALFLVLVIGFAFFWAIRSGQFEDMEGPAYRILMDDDDPRIPHDRVEVSEDSPQAPREAENQSGKSKAPPRNPS